MPVINDNIHKDHRKRLRRRYENNGLDSFEDHNILELLLFNSIPRADTNPIAHHLLNRFGSLYNVMTASLDDLCEVEGIGPSSATLIRTVWDTARETKIRALSSESLKSYEKLYLYAVEWFAGKPQGTVAVLFLDCQNRPINVAEISKEHAHVPASFQETIEELCRRFNSKAAILMHNHADGNMHPSANDLQLTASLFYSLKEVGITLQEHIILHAFDCIPILNESVGENVSHFICNSKIDS